MLSVIMCQSREYKIVLPFKVPGVLGFTTVGGSGCENVSYHVPIQIITMLLPFPVLGGWGGG